MLQGRIWGGGGGGEGGFGGSNPPFLDLDRNGVYGLDYLFARHLTFSIYAVQGVCMCASK